MTPTFRYAHLADLHLGSWRDEKMRELSTKAFLQAMDTCIGLKIDFILFAGDIFNTSLPGIDTLKTVTKKLKELKDKEIPLYVIAGSHDFSPSGKTMIDVLEHAGLLINVCKGAVDPQTNKLHLRFTVDRKTRAKITGILGRKGQLDKKYYEDLAHEPLEQEQGYKIFMFHTSISELKPKHLEQIESQPASFLPKGFAYYAGGHIHHRNEVLIPEYGLLTYPGALFPNNFAEVEKYSHGGFYVVTVSEEEREEEEEEECEKKSEQEIEQEKKQELKNELENEQKLAEAENHKRTQIIEWLPVEVAKHHKVFIDCTNKSPEVIIFEILNHFHNQDLQKNVITIRLSGMLAEGGSSQINWKEIFDQLYQQGAEVIMKNTAELHAEDFEEIHIAEAAPEVMEERVIREHLQQSEIFSKEIEFHLAVSLLSLLNTNKKEGETVADFQQRICSETKRVMEEVP
ncbi:metallophosphoesterase [Candidatus Woesearchaeota archaeon]|nr:metallophosphoesterase [Candidatus Woesearchaeota archaeon]